MEGGRGVEREGGNVGGNVERRERETNSQCVHTSSRHRVATVQQGSFNKCEGNQTKLELNQTAKTAGSV